MVEDGEDPEAMELREDGVMEILMHMVVMEVTVTHMQDMVDMEVGGGLGMAMGQEAR